MLACFKLFSKSFENCCLAGITDSLNKGGEMTLDAGKRPKQFSKPILMRVSVSGRNYFKSVENHITRDNSCD
jgi:hypothetical protein